MPLILPFVRGGHGFAGADGQGLDALSLGEAQAQSLGINPTQPVGPDRGGHGPVGRSAVTSVTGADRLYRPGGTASGAARWSAMRRARGCCRQCWTGAVRLLCSDIAARLVHTNPELVSGVFTSLLGTPFFFWLVVRIRKVAP